MRIKTPTSSSMHYAKTTVFSEVNSPRQTKEISTDWGETWLTLTDEKRKKLKRSQFAFGSLYPYVFDGLSYAATHLGEKIFQSHSKYYYELEMPIDELCHLSLMEYQQYNKEYFRHEILRRGSTSDKEEAKNLRCIPIDKGKSISIQPLIIGFGEETPQIPGNKRLMNLKTYTEGMKPIQNVIILILKIFIDPILYGSGGGWFSCPAALQAKIIHTLMTMPPKKNLLDPNIDKFNPIFSANLEARFLRKYLLYLNSIDGSQDAKYMIVDAIDLWEHVSPSQINVNGNYKHIRDWNTARIKLETANEFFADMDAKGLMEGAKAFPTICPKGIFYNKNNQTYKIYFKRNIKLQFKWK